MPTTLSLSRPTRGIVSRWPALLAAGACIATFATFPPFRVLSQKSLLNAHVEDRVFSAVAFAEDFWTRKLMVAAKEAPLVEAILTDVRKDPAAASSLHGIKAGLGNAGYFFSRGKGKIIGVERSRVLVSVDGSILAIRSGPLFGNQVRDGSGLLNVNEVPGLTEFNALSSELNKLVEQRVQPVLNKAVLGDRLEFSGIAEAPETLPKDGSPLLTFTPLSLEVSL